MRRIVGRPHKQEQILAQFTLCSSKGARKGRIACGRHHARIASCTRHTWGRVASIQDCAKRDRGFDHWTSARKGRHEGVMALWTKVGQRWSRPCPCEKPGRSSNHVRLVDTQGINPETRSLAPHLVLHLVWEVPVVLSHLETLAIDDGIFRSTLSPHTYESAKYPLVQRTQAQLAVNLSGKTSRPTICNLNKSGRMV